MIAKRRRWLRNLARTPTAFGGAVVLLMVMLAALLAPVFSPYPPYEGDLTARLRAPLSRGNDGFHLFGTDGLGRDIFSRVMFGARISLVIGALATLFGGVIGVTLGLLAGYYRGRLDAAVMRLVDIQLSVPFLILVIALVAVLGNGVVNVITALMVAAWILYARVVRSEVLSLREKEFVEAARAVGASDVRILRRHMAPNLMSSLSVLSSLEIGRLILAEASLSFLGLGVPPPIPTWGRMVAEGQQYVFNAWWVAFFPGLAILSTVLALNLLGDWIRDMTDPKLQHAR